MLLFCGYCFLSQPSLFPSRLFESLLFYDNTKVVSVQYCFSSTIVSCCCLHFCSSCVSSCIIYIINYKCDLFLPIVLFACCISCMGNSCFACSIVYIR